MCGMLNIDAVVLLTKLLALDQRRKGRDIFDLVVVHFPRMDRSQRVVNLLLNTWNGKPSPDAVPIRAE